MAASLMPEEPKKLEATSSTATVDQCQKKSKGAEHVLTSEQQKMVEHLFDKNNKVTVMIAGKARMGKSTAFNNLFGLELETGHGQLSVTKVVIKKSTSMNGVELCVLDTPGAQTIDTKETNRILKEASSHIPEGADHFTLLYCVSVYAPLSADDKYIVKKITSRFGPNIWRRCILVLTHCDTFRNENFKTDDKDTEYKKSLKDYANTFEKIIRDCTRLRLSVRSILDSDDDVKMSEDQTKTVDKGKFRMPSFKSKAKVKQLHTTIVAVPAAKTRKDGKNPNILPCKNMNPRLDWSDYAYAEILKKSGKFTPALFQIRYNIRSLFTGVAAGATVGGLVGLPAGPVTAAAGAVTGAIAGLYIPILLHVIDEDDQIFV